MQPDVRLTMINHSCTYSLLDGLTWNTAWYFTSFVCIFPSQQGEEICEKRVKCQTVFHVKSFVIFDYSTFIGFLIEYNFLKIDLRTQHVYS